MIEVDEDKVEVVVVVAEVRDGNNDSRRRAVRDHTVSAGPGTNMP